MTTITTVTAAILFVWLCCKCSFTAGFIPKSCSRDTIFGASLSKRAFRQRERRFISFENRVLENLFYKRPNSYLQSTSSNTAASNGNGNGDNDFVFFESLRQRQQELSQKTQELTRKWKKGDCKSTIPLVFPDWVRRLDIDYPLVACGSAQETIYLGHLERGQVIAESTKSTNMDDDASDLTEEGKGVSDLKLEETLRFMFGGYDGGGTLSIALHGSLICEGGRSGGVRIWRVNPASKRLLFQGFIPAMNGLLATCLHLEEDRCLWVGTHTGQVHAYRLDNPLKPLALQTTPYLVWDFGNSCVSSLDFCHEYSCGVAALSGGSVALFSTQKNNNGIDSNEGTIVASIYPPFDSTERRAANIYPSVASFVRMKPTNDDEDMLLSLAVGGSDGSIYCQQIALSKDKQDDTCIDFDRPFQESIQQMGQSHRGGGLVKAMTCPAPNVLVTFGQDGCLKVWDMANRTLYYHFAGYKVWGGSLWSDGRRLVSDGVDNTILMHDFASSEEDAF